MVTASASWRTSSGVDGRARVISVLAAPTQLTQVFRLSGSLVAAYPMRRQPERWPSSRLGIQFTDVGYVLVRPVIEEVEATPGRKTKVAQLMPVTQPHMVDLLCRAAIFTHFDARSKKE